MRRICFPACMATVTILATGCVPARLVDGIRFAADRYRVRDASTLIVPRSGHLRFDTRLASDLDDAIALDDTEAARSEGMRILRSAHTIAVEAVEGEVDRMPVDGLAFIVGEYSLNVGGGTPSGQREAIKRRFRQDARAALDHDIARLQNADKVTRFLRVLRRDIEAFAGDRGKLGRVLLTAPLFMPAIIGAQIADAEATQRSMTANFTRVVRYVPADDGSPPTAEQLASADAAQLAKWYAPIIVQERNPDAPYPASEDQFGRVHLTGPPDEIVVHVDIDDPVVYWAKQHAKVRSKRYDQLVYVAWYSSRPAIKPGDSEAGHIDGVVLRITLDSRHRPAVYEYVRTCGCQHVLWVAEFVEAAAREAYGPPVDGRRFAVQVPRGSATERQPTRTSPTGGRRELFIPELIPDDGSCPRRPVACVGAGHHLLMAVGPNDPVGSEAQTIERRTYRLEPYSALTRLVLGDGVASMFGSDGLVHGSGRKAGWLLAPTGMLSAGQPRQLGTMKIRMDAYDYDDPRLLDRHLRLPPEF